ncbi:MAG TPA: RodZ domain-containing protein, partial [Steroidobacteraceae bacterium]
MMEEGAAQSPSSSPGARLAAAREQAGMTLVQAAERLRLDVATLQALEAGRFETLGATVFVRGHLRHYAELVGVPLDEIDAAYAASSAKLAAQPDLRRTTTLPGNAAPRGVSLPPRAALIGAIVLVLVALVWWAMRVPAGQRHAANPSASSPATSPPAGSQAADAVDAGPAPQAASAALNPVASAPPPRADAAASAKTAPSALSKEATARDANSKDAGPKDAASAFKSAVLGDKSQTPAPKAASTRVRFAIHFNQDSWIEVYDARGATLFHDFGGAGSERRVSGTAPLRVLIGNPDGVGVELNGHPISLKPAAESGRPQRFLLDSDGGM